jgi:hypothetical protein
MSQKNRRASAAARDLREELVARNASRRFQRLFGGPSERGNIRLTRLEPEIELCREPFDKSRIGFARASPQLMIEVTDNEPPVSKMVKLMEERDRIAPAGDADEIGLARRKLPENLQLEMIWFGSFYPHFPNVEALAAASA